MGLGCMTEVSDDLLVQQRCGWKLGRLRREDCQFVKHDKLFSKWKILMGPSDSTEHRMNSAETKVGTYKHHVQNLPAAGAQSAGPGVYELGVTAPSWSKLFDPNNASRALKREDVIPVYVGQAANVRQRLQKYGQLEHASPRSPKLHQGDLNSPRNGFKGDTSAAKSSSGSGPRLFSEVFALGSSIAFRWAHTDSKVVAEQVESELLSVFDYAWNKAGSSSGTRRSRDILAKLFMAWPTKHTATSSLTSSRLCNLILPGKRSLFGLCRRTNAVGIKVALRKPHEPTNDSAMSNLCFLMTVQPQRVAPPRRKRHKNKPAASTKVVQAETTRARRHNSLSFNTWVKGETDQRVHNMSEISAHNASPPKVYGSSISKRRVQHLGSKYASVSDSDSVMRR